MLDEAFGLKMLSYVLFSGFLRRFLNVYSNISHTAVGYFPPNVPGDEHMPVGGWDVAGM